MQNYTNGSILMSLIPLAILSVIFAVVAHLLARDKGRSTALWTVLGLIPVVNIYCMCFFIGATNRRLERKIDRLLEHAGIDASVFESR